MRFIHAADLHVDSPLAGLERYEGAPVEAVRGATRRALENLVELCIAREARLLLIAGDLFDGKWRDFSTGLFFVRQMARLREADVDVVVVRGNHDADSQIPRHLRLPENVHELPSDRPSTIELERLGIAVHGQSYATRATTDDLAAGYPRALGGVLNVGLLHTALDGRPGHEPYAPTSEARLVDKGYAYWALGHIHTREVVRAGDPWIVFPGNLQGRHARERGAKGATVVEVVGSAITKVEHAALDVVRFEDVTVELEGDDDLDDAIDRARAGMADALAAADGRLLAARVRLTGTSKAHAALAVDPRTPSELRAAALDLVGDSIWLASVKSDVQVPIDPSALRTRTDAIGRLAAAARACGADPAEAAVLLERLGELRAKVPGEIVDGAVPGPDDAEGRARFFAEVEELLWAKLGDRGGPEADG